MEKKNTGTYYLMFISSMVIYGTIGIFRRYIPLSSGLLSFTRGLLGAASLFIFTYRTKGGLKKRLRGIPASKIAVLALCGVILGVNWIFLFEAFNYTTVAIATLCAYFQPIIVILLSPLIFRERLTPLRLGCAGAAIAGMVLLSGAFGQELPPTHSKGVALGLAAALCYATIVILNKKLTGVDGYDRTVIQLGSATLALLPYLLLTKGFSGVQLDGRAVLMLLIVGLVHTGFAYGLYFGSVEHLRAQSVAILSYLDPAVALLVSVTILKEPMSLLSLAGAVLIIGAALCSELFGNK
jgi:RarD protein